MKPKKVIQCGLFTAFIAVGAYIRIPLPHVPITLQTLFVLLSGLLLDKGYGAVPSLCYLLLGLMGLPIFTGGGGVAYLAHPTFGYLLGFVAAGWLMGRIKNGRQFPRLFYSALAGIGVIDLCGTAYYCLWTMWYANGNLTVLTLLTTCVFTTLPTDVLAAALAATIAKRVQ